MQIKGWRKLVMTGIIGGLIVAKPDLTDTQVHLLNTLILAAFAGNGIEHLKEAIQNGRVPGRNSDSPVRSVSDLSGEPTPRFTQRSTH